MNASPLISVGSDAENDKDRVGTFPDQEQVFKVLDQSWAIRRKESRVGPERKARIAIFVRLVAYSDVRKKKPNAWLTVSVILGHCKAFSKINTLWIDGILMCNLRTEEVGDRSETMRA
jgi:hypothetical protein